ncbi:hypothetical protein GGR50DRAFT_399493 [Xylaria sp. CBS 124048]|nr:hypothetical protein GGR50DRAFT_399493 [Xylaria sp. CBS 124048]
MLPCIDYSCMYLPINSFSVMRAPSHPVVHRFAFHQHIYLLHLPSCLLPLSLSYLHTFIPLICPLPLTGAVLPRTTYLLTVAIAANAWVCWLPCQSSSGINNVACLFLLATRVLFRPAAQNHTTPLYRHKSNSPALNFLVTGV